MEGSGESILKWRLTLAETLAFGVTIVSVTLFMVQNFQSKEDAEAWKIAIESRISSLESKMDSFQESQSKIAVDVSYIRGRLEPKNR